MITDFWPSATPCASAASTTLIPHPELRRARSRRQIGTPLDGTATTPTSPKPKVIALAGVTVAIEDPDGTECIVSADGNFLVLLQCLRSRSPHRLYVERIARQTIHDVVSHSMIFEGLQPFLCWCERDTLRFDPHTLQQLKRAGHELLAVGR